MIKHLWCLIASLLLSHTTALCQSTGEFDQAVHEIDRLIQQRWNEANVQPANTSDDAEFCRRLWMDLAGVAPPVSIIRDFLSDNRADKRDRLIDAVLDSPQHANHMAERWTQVLLPANGDPNVNSNDLKRWLREKFNQNLPYDYLVGSFLTAGGTSDRGPTVFYTSHELEPKKLAAATSRIFMGIQLQCAECHDHPFDKWTQEDFWQYAAFFSQLSQSSTGNNGQTIIEDRPGGQVTLPDTEKEMEPRYPGVAEAPEEDPGDIRRRQLTIWMASRDNPYLARAAVNRVWAQMFGRGIVDPVDAMDADNKPSHPELLQMLSDYFIQQRFDLRKLYSAIARSRAYQLTSTFESDDRPAEDLFAVQNVKTLTAEQLYDVLQQNVLRRTDTSQQANGLRQRFIARMQSTNESPLEYPHGVVQALGMMNGPEVARATNPTQGLLASLDAPFFDDSKRIQTLYLATLSRMPSAAEQQRCQDLLSQAKSAAAKKQVLSDILWAILNAAEFAVCP